MLKSFWEKQKRIIEKKSKVKMLFYRKKLEYAIFLKFEKFHVLQSIPGRLVHIQ